MRRWLVNKQGPTSFSPDQQKNAPTNGAFCGEYALMGQIKPDYFNKDNTPCADWLACANMAVAACEMICDLAMLVVSEA
jgi:hypothetical protein